jgi:hypothetical protein
MLLIAVTGCGAKEVLKLTVHTIQGKVFCPATFDGYSIRHFGADLKECFASAVFNKRLAIFCIDEYQIIINSFFDYIRALLLNQIPNSLYSPEEVRAILSQLNHASYEEFKATVRQYFRVVVILDPPSPTYSSILKSQPLLESQCTILNVSDPSEGVLADMTRSFFQN